MRNPTFAPGTRNLTWQGALGIAIASASLTYLFDPANGRRRRGLVRDKLIHLGHVAGTGSRRATMDLGHRARGVAANIRTKIRSSEPVPDEILAERVRANMGVVVSHPHAIEVHAEDGVVSLSGAILRREADKLVFRTRRVPGVREVVDALERHKTSDNAPMLQGGAPRIRRPELLQEHWTPGIRLLAAAAGASVLYLGLGQRGPGRALTTALGAGLLLRSVTNLSTPRMLGVPRDARGIEFQKAIHIDAPVEKVFSFFRNFENLPRFMSHLEAVEVHGDRSHWVASGPGGVRIRWNALLTRVEENKLLAWRSTRDSGVRSAGAVRFDADPRGGTRVSVRMSYSPPAGAFGHLVAILFGKTPKKAMDDDLLRLKSILEEKTDVESSDQERPTPPLAQPETSSRAPS